MAHKEAKHGIHINMISPGPMKADIFKKKDFPMSRETKYKDITNAINFLISREAYYINGSNLEVAGGFL